MPTENDGTDIRSLIEGAMAADPATQGSDDAPAQGTTNSNGAVDAVPDEVRADGGDSGGGEGNKPDSPSAVRARDPSGKFSKAEKSATEAPKPAKASPSVTPAPKGAEPSATPAPAPGEQSVALKAPQSWRPAAREKWAALPPEVQQEVAKREKEAKLAIDGSSPDREYAKQVRESLAPFEPFLRSQGVTDTVGAARGLMQTMQNLAHSPPAQKAQIIKSMMEQFGVPVDELDRQLAGEGQPKDAQGQYRDPRVDQLIAQIEQGKQQREQANNERIQSELATFGESHEFFEDVRQEMSDLIRAAGQRGHSMSWEQAYNRAVRGNDELWSILEQRKAAEAANAQQASTQRAKNASSSVRNQPATPVSGNSSKDVRGAIEAAIALHSGR